MDPRLLDCYNRELQHLRELGGEFAKEYPKIAGRLGLEGFECADPYVERMLEGFAFLSARVQLKIDDEFPRFTQHLLEIVYPHYLAPTPSMTVVRMDPDPDEGNLQDGYILPRDSILQSIVGKGEQTPCEYRTAHELTLWPFALTEAEYFTGKEPIEALRLAEQSQVKAGIRLRLATTLPDLEFGKIPLDRLPLYLHGSDEIPALLYEQLLADCIAVVLRPIRRPLPWFKVLPTRSLCRIGFEDEQALLPFTPPSFQGYRLLHEYFAFPERYRFIELTNLQSGLTQSDEKEVEILILLNKTNPRLENTLDASNFVPFCTPAINLFPKRADRIHLSEQVYEHHVVPDRTRPMDFEVYQVKGVQGIGADYEQDFLPFYAANHQVSNQDRSAYYTARRLPRMISSTQRRRGGTRSTYLGSEIYLNLVDSEEAPYRSNLSQLAVKTWCTNRDLPLHMPVGQGVTDFTLESGAPIAAVRCLAGPTRPQPSHAHGDTAWRLISHLSLNYLSLLDHDEKQGAAALRELLQLYGNLAEASVRKQIDGVRSVRAVPITRRAPIPGPIAFARGKQITIDFDESAFEGSGLFLLGAVLDAFFAKYVSINAFTETIVRSSERGEIIQWPVRIGKRHIL